MKYASKAVAHSLELARRVLNDFPDPGWPLDQRVARGAVSGAEAVYIDAHFVGKRWQDITDEELGWAGHDSWAFSDPGLAYFLPAFLVSYLKDRFDGASIFGGIYFGSWIRRLSPFRTRGFNLTQVRLLRRVWQQIVEDFGEDDEVLICSQILEEEIASWPG